MGGTGALERVECRRRRQQLAQHNHPRHANALVLQVELCDAVLAQRGERDPAEVSHHDVLEHHRGQMVGRVARNTIEADAVTHTDTGAGDVREMMGLPQSVCFLVSGR